MGTRISLTGDLGAPEFEAWICHRARLLSLSGWVERLDHDHIEIVVRGPAPLVDAMELACSLGPTTVLVERINRTDAADNSISNGFAVRAIGVRERPKKGHM